MIYFEIDDIPFGKKANLEVDRYRWNGIEGQCQAVWRTKNERKKRKKKKQKQNKKKNKKHV